MTLSNALSTHQATAFAAAPVSHLVPLLGRILLASLFLLSGYGKISAPDATMAYIQMVGLPVPMAAYAAAVLVETVGSLALVVGYQTRLVALAMAAFSVATALAFHTDFSNLDQFIHFFKNVAIAGGLLQVVAFGPGRYSLDAHR